MQRLIRPVAALVILVVVLGLAFIDADAQTRRKRRSRRVPRPVITNPTITTTDETSAIGEPRVLSTADETTSEPDTTKARKKKPATEEDMQQTINALSNQVNRLTDKLTQMQGNDRSLLDMERLTRAEQRSESLRSQQLAAETKLADLQSQMEQIDYALKPENIERVTSGYGSTRPEDARDTRRRQLESEKARLQVQIRLLETSRTRLETAVANSDAEVDMLRRRLQQNDAPPTVVVDSQPTPTPGEKPE